MLAGTVVATAKLLTTPDDPSIAAEHGLARLLQTFPGREVGEVVHGTTLVANALIERKGAVTALLTTKGFRDVLSIRREQRFDLYDLFLDLPEPLVPRRLRYELDERVLADGSVDRPLQPEAVRRVARRLRRDGVESIAVSLLHSYRNDAHERTVARALHEELPDLPVSLSSDVSPEVGEFLRTSTTVANAYVSPLVRRYVELLEKRMEGLGLSGPLRIMLSTGGGGLAGAATARRYPVRLLESGPAAGALSAGFWGTAAGRTDVLAFDMGGTTAKACLIEDGRPLVAREVEAARVYRFTKGSGLPLRVPVVDLIEVGAGGGSIAGVGPFGLPTVGPESTGADPGPACYGRGGTAPTVTDADLLLGRIDPTGFSGGRMALGRDAAEAAMRREIAEPMALALELAALGASEIVDANMANAARVHAIESGKDARGRTLIAFGGAAPLHAARLAEKLGLDRVLVPSYAGVGSAVGFLRAPIAYEIVRSSLQRLDQFDAAAANALFAAMRGEAEPIVRRGAAAAPLTETRSAFMRYRGQGHEIAVPLSTRIYHDDDAALLHAAFADEYRRLYSRVIPGVEVEILSLVLLLSPPVTAGTTPPLPSSDPLAPEPAPSRL